MLERRRLLPVDCLLLVWLATLLLVSRWIRMRGTLGERPMEQVREARTMVRAPARMGARTRRATEGSTEGSMVGSMEVAAAARWCLLEVRSSFANMERREAIGGHGIGERGVMTRIEDEEAGVKKGIYGIMEQLQAVYV